MVDLRLEAALNVEEHFAQHESAVGVLPGTPLQVAPLTQDRAAAIRRRVGGAKRGALPAAIPIALRVPPS